MQIDDFTGRIFNEDCISVMQRIPSNSVHAIICDPPFGNSNHDGDLNSMLNGHRGIEDKPIANDDLEGMRRVVDAMLTEAVRVLKDDCSVVCCCCGGGGPKPTFAWLANRMDTGGLKFFHSVIWDKVNPGLGWRYRRQHEMIMVAHKEKGKLLWANDDVAIPNVMKFSKDRDCEHPNQKPEALMARFIEAHTKPGEIVMDVFAGSCTTLVVAERLGRKWIGCELDPKYCIIGNRRINEEKSQMKLF